MKVEAFLRRAVACAVCGLALAAPVAGAGSAAPEASRAVSAADSVQAPCDGLERARGTMGTIARVVICEAPDEGAAAGAAGAALDAIDRVDRVMSLYRPESDLSRLNREGRSRQVALDPWLIELLEASRALTRQTSGAFDVTIKPLMDYYGFYSGLGFAPPPGGLRGALRAVGSEGLVIVRRAGDEPGGTAGFRRDGMGVDAGGIAKGFALDRAADVLRERGVERAIVELGRSFYFLGAGPIPGGLWPAGIVDPSLGESVGICLQVPSGALSTSSPSGRLAVTPAGSVGHVLDPERGAFSTDRVQVTIWSASGLRSDALSKAAFLLSARKLNRLLARGGEWALVSRRPGGLAGASGGLESTEYGSGRSFVRGCGG